MGRVGEDSEEIIDAGDHLIQAIHFRGRGRGSGVEVEGRFFQVHTVKDGKTVQLGGVL